MVMLVKTEKNRTEKCEKLNLTEGVSRNGKREMHRLGLPPSVKPSYPLSSHPFVKSSLCQVIPLSSHPFVKSLCPSLCLLFAFVTLCQVFIPSLSLPPLRRLSSIWTPLSLVPFVRSFYLFWISAPFVSFVRSLYSFVFVPFVKSLNPLVSVPFVFASFVKFLYPVKDTVSQVFVPFVKHLCSLYSLSNIL